MSVNLDRLREAREAKVRTRSDVIAIDEASIAVLDAPREFRCEWGYKAVTDGCRDGLHVDAKGLGYCGWVVLVPVEGEGR